MMGLVIKTNDDFVGLTRLSRKQTKQALYKSAGYVRTTAKNSIKYASWKRQLKQAKKEQGSLSRDEYLAIRYAPSKPGTPPNTHTGQLPKSIAFAASDRAGTFVVGPKRSDIAEIGHVHEFGGKFRGRNYPARPFMRPALVKSEAVIRENFRGMFRQSYQGGS
jgi:hypothetical protein